MTRYLVITGASRGIGLATALLFLKMRYEVFNISRTSCALSGVKNFIADLSQPETLAPLLNEIQNALPNDSEVVLVHNAAFYQQDSLINASLTVLQQTCNIILVSPILINQYLVPKMKPGSSIIYIGTVLSEKAVPGYASYTIAKHGLVGLMRVTCQDLIKQQIRSNMISPGLVNTQLLHETMHASDVEFLLENKIIGKRLIEPNEIADLIYVCSQSAVLNGAIIDANLGQIAE